MWSGSGTGTVGYYGIQSEGGTPFWDRHVHFTVWDAQVNKPAYVVAKSDDVICEHTPTEGGGMVCYWKIDLSVNHDYKLVIKAETVGETTQYTSFILYG